MKNVEETICAVATPPGMGGIGVIKISGPEAVAVPARIFRASRPVKTFQSHRLYHGFIVNAETGKTIDEVLLVVMRAPHTYTCEDVVEIQTHSSMAAISAVMEQVLKLGIRPAEPGEFTKRAFLNGRIDLTQAEAVIDLIRSKTEKGLSLAAHQIEGGLFDLVCGIRKSLIRIIARIEAMIDFPEDMEEETSDTETELTDGVISPLKDLLEKYETGHLFREGIEIIIIGRPNVGKSSLLNRLLRKERAIVTPVPGTTRDIIEEGLSIKGIPTKIIDTAGLRETSDNVESAGIEFTKKRLSRADLILFMIDISEGLTPEDLSIYDEIRDRKKIIVANKIDLIQAWSVKEISQRFPATHNVVEISARFNNGIDRLTDVIYAAITGSREMEPPSVAPNLRHKRAIERALRAAQTAQTLMRQGDSPALIAIEVQEGLDALGEITGDTTSEEILDEIFSRFCIGK